MNIRRTCLVVKSCAAGGILRATPERAIFTFDQLQRAAFAGRTGIFRFLRFAVIVIACSPASRVLGTAPKLSVPAVSRLQNAFAALGTRIVTLDRNIQTGCSRANARCELRLLPQEFLQTFAAFSHALQYVFPKRRRIRVSQFLRQRINQKVR